MKYRKIGQSEEAKQGWPARAEPAPNVKKGRTYGWSFSKNTSELYGPGLLRLTPAKSTVP